MDRLKGKAAIVTGAAHGIGAAIATQFAREGAAVLLFDKDFEAAKAHAEALRASHDADTVALHGDVTMPDDVRGMVETVVERFGGLDILVNNAALTGFGRAIDSEDMEARYDLILATNLKSVWMAIHHAAPHLKARAAASSDSCTSVINIASVHGLVSGSHNSAYAATKGALIAGTHGLAIELAAHRVRVNCISPGLIRSGDDHAWIRRTLSPEQFQEFQQRFGDLADRGRALQQPLPIVGLPEDVAHAAVFLASDESRFCTGTNLVIDGGVTSLLPSPVHVSAEILAHRQREAERHEWLDAARKSTAVHD